VNNVEVQRLIMKTRILIHKKLVQNCSSLFKHSSYCTRIANLRVKLKNEMKGTILARTMHVEYRVVEGWMGVCQDATNRKLIKMQNSV
jgi:hypothetical protein